MAEGKVCSKCKQFKLKDEYVYSKIHKGNMYSSCKVCTRLRAAEYNSRPEVKEAAKLYRQTYQEKPEVAKKRRERGKNHKRALRLTEEGRKKNAETVKRWRESNPDESRRRIRLANQKRKAAKFGSESRKVTTADARRILASPCVNCDSREHIHIDHIVPLSRGGRHAIGNLQALCSFCNLSKNNSLQIEWKMRQLQMAKLKEVSL
jgi:5-methylcytosine-specific restriction endonuclease McrA